MNATPLPNIPAALAAVTPMTQTDYENAIQDCLDRNDTYVAARLAYWMDTAHPSEQGPTRISEVGKRGDKYFAQVRAANGSIFESHGDTIGAVIAAARRGATDDTYTIHRVRNGRRDCGLYQFVTPSVGIDRLRGYTNARSVTTDRYEIRRDRDGALMLEIWYDAETAIWRDRGLWA